MRRAGDGRLTTCRNRHICAKTQKGKRTYKWTFWNSALKFKAAADEWIIDDFKLLTSDLFSDVYVYVSSALSSKMCPDINEITWLKEDLWQRPWCVFNNSCVGFLPWPLVSVAVGTKQEICNQILLSWALPIPGTQTKRFLQWIFILKWLLYITLMTSLWHHQGWYSPTD